MLSLRTTRVELPPGWDVRATTVKNYIVSSSSSSASLSSSLFRASNNIKLLREVRATLWRQKKVIMATDYSLGLEETELRLGLPGGVGGGGGGGEGDATKNSGKRAFAETIDLKLKLQTAADVEEVATEEMKRSPSQKSVVACAIDPEKPSAPKAQVVGWPPVRSYRKNILAVQTEKASKEDGEKPGNSAAFVKVCMDGAPYLRKVDLKMYRSYQELSMALEKMFSSFTSANCGSQGMSGRDFMSEGKLMVLINGSEYVPTYEDKDGDWMLVGDVPWQMFVDSCKRLRIMKGSEAVGLAPRAMEKCKSRT